jgi:cobalamin-dependent methionine synthase I
MVVMLFDEAGQADVLARKIEVARRSYELLTNAGIPATSIIFDPNVLAIATGIDEHDGYARDFIEAVRWIKTNLPAYRSAAVSATYRSPSEVTIGCVRRCMPSSSITLAPQDWIWRSSTLRPMFPMSGFLRMRWL